MLLWMIYVVIVTLILSAAALSAERALRLRRAATRWVWVAAVVGSLVIPTIIASVSIQIPNITAQNVPRKAIILRDATSLRLTALSQIPALHPTSRASGMDTQLKRSWLFASEIMLLLLAGSAV